ncbi:CBS domain-containing protein [Pseudoalteromonas sp. JBTF-M23]|uniref:CBS domain-containing protein n=1 Tax=Pseudoalteromonas caenipelagi TaxID=2726988 RepID=A0A849VIK8_9GAMM|nr:CBS domain-containing protein [Pseudoalteromonas caenipelagi]NOU52508.1 CBS domain-containing protein [Pseudoalteromonas caenipelagi]
MSKYQTIGSQALATNTHFNTSLDSNVTISLDSPASEAMHGFHQVPPQLIDSSTGLNDALLIMEQTHMRISFVVDSHNNMLGIISKARLSSSYVLKISAKTGISRADMTVVDVMIPLSSLSSVNELAVRSARVGDIVKSMEMGGHEHLLVVSQAPERICGYFDLIDISRMVGYQLNQVKSANSFSEIVDSLWHHAEI